MTKKYEVWLANLEPRFGSEPGKTRPVVVVQANTLNGRLNSTMICPITSKVIAGANILRIHLQTGEAGLLQSSDILTSQVRAIDNRRFVQKLGSLPSSVRPLLDDGLRVVLDLP